MKKIICIPESFDDENNTIYFEPGLCNLKEFTKVRAMKNIFWHQKIDEFRGILSRLIDFTNDLTQQEVYNTDLKPENIILYSESYLFIKLIDIGNCSFNYKKITCYTSFYLN